LVLIQQLKCRGKEGESGAEINLNRGWFVSSECVPRRILEAANVRGNWICTLRWARKSSGIIPTGKLDKAPDQSFGDNCMESQPNRSNCALTKWSDTSKNCETRLGEINMASPEKTNPQQRSRLTAKSEHRHMREFK
jgi:hypothetical protein